MALLNEIKLWSFPINVCLNYFSISVYLQPEFPFCEQFLAKSFLKSLQTILSKQKISTLTLISKSLHSLKTEVLGGKAFDIKGNNVFALGEMPLTKMPT